MRVLIVGGSVFLGRALAAEAWARGHQLTLFNRGIAASAPEPGVTLIKGDRNGDLGGLQAGSWDAVVDTCGYFPGQVSRLLGALAGRVGHYTFVSTVSAYADLGRSGLSEGDELARLAGPVPEKVTPETYGALKALCEAAALASAIPTLVVRPGIIAGPHDPTDRFGYWIERLARGGEVLAPGRSEAPVQLIDARDLAAWILSQAEPGQTGVFNAAGPTSSLTFGEMLQELGRELNPAARLTWIDDAFLQSNGLTEWTKLPLYVPASEAKFAGMFRVDASKARSRGLKLRTLAETAVDTWRWMQSRAGGPAVKNGLDRQKEEALLAAWRGRA